VGREMVSVRTEGADGNWQQRTIWVVDYDGDPWLHSAGEAWQFEVNPYVEMTRGGSTERYRALPDRRAHAAVDEALRRKYGLADRWVRFLAPCDDSVLPVRLRKVRRSP
jgi:hypothetical protein